MDPEEHFNDKLKPLRKQLEEFKQEEFRIGTIYHNSFHRTMIIPLKPIWNSVYYPKKRFEV